MRTLITVSLVAATAGPAFAQTAPTAPTAPIPATAAGACSVTIVRAPDPVRQTVEQWLAKEHCTLALQVRIIPTEGGLYVLATDERGRVRERIVPDAASAGVLIASWAADDGLGGAAPVPAAPAAPVPMAPPAVGVPPAGYSQPAYTGPAPSYPPPAYQPGSGRVAAFGPGDFHPTTANDDDDDGEPTKVEEPPHPEKYLTLAAGLVSNGGAGLRAEVDLYSKNGWTIGAAFGLTSTAMWTSEFSPYYSSYADYTAHITDYSLALTIGHLWRFGNWHLRGSAGLGLVVSSMELDSYDYQTNTNQAGNGSMTSPYVETSVMAGHSIGASKVWGIEAGPVISYTKQGWYLSDSMATLYREAGSIMFVVGLRHGL